MLAGGRYADLVLANQITRAVQIGLAFGRNEHAFPILASVAPGAVSVIRTVGYQDACTIRAYVTLGTVGVRVAGAKWWQTNAIDTDLIPRAIAVRISCRRQTAFVPIPNVQAQVAILAIRIHLAKIRQGSTAVGQQKQNPRQPCIHIDHPIPFHGNASMDLL